MCGRVPVPSSNSCESELMRALVQKTTRVSILKIAKYVSIHVEILLVSGDSVSRGVGVSSSKGGGVGRQTGTVSPTMIFS